ncbi:4a-hydroxytetrahydrobiopterin dehydratase [Microbacterium halophytorum]|uniref:4a-hydroxytetrahydrobiopterin dehydratase n=1 Tax=Microbacterium halophytorum TaxID=2067568 RepID=UPI000CFCAEEE|nr:4a-hydroxytetrahydrobiopterin dehydratase [Microbacterium halophytorum]
MAERISAEQFAALPEVADWHAADDHARARFRTGSFAAGVELVAAIGALADAANHHPDVLLTYPEVTVTLTTHDAGGLTVRDADLARQISRAARERSIPAA